MQVTNEQLDKAAQAVWRVTSDGLGLTWAWTDQAAVSRDFYRKLALAVVATLPDAPEPIEGERRFTAERTDYPVWHVHDAALEPGVAASFATGLVDEGCAAAMMRAAADAAERWHRAEKAKGRKRWRVSDLHGHCALGPQDQVVWFHMAGGAKRDPEACADWVARENARLDAKERSGPFEARRFGAEAWIVVDTRSGNRVATHLPDYSQMEAAAKRDAAERNARLDAEEGYD